MPLAVTTRVSTAPRQSRWRIDAAIAALLVILSLPDLFAPPISPTIFRQTQTYEQTKHLVAGGFKPNAMAIDVDGARPLRLVYEFPVYQALVGLLFAAFGS